MTYSKFIHFGWYFCNLNDYQYISIIRLRYLNCLKLKTCQTNMLNMLKQLSTTI